LQRHENDYFTIIVGGHGKGKSYLGSQIAACVSDNFNNDCIIYSDTQYLLTEKAMSRGDTIQLDEGVLFLNSKKHSSKSVTDMHEFLQLVRMDGVHHIVCVGELKDLIGYIRDFRRDSIIIIEKIGKYKIVYSKVGCNIISEIYPKIRKDINKVKLRGNHFVHGESNIPLPTNVDWNKYKTLKKDNLEAQRSKLLEKSKKGTEEERTNSTTELVLVDELIGGLEP